MPDCLRGGATAAAWRTLDVVLIVAEAWLFWVGAVLYFCAGAAWSGAKVAARTLTVMLSPAGLIRLQRWGHRVSGAQ